MGETVNATQFDSHGRLVRQVEIYISIPSDGGTVHLAVQNLPQGRTANYSMRREAWEKLCAVQPHKAHTARQPDHHEYEPSEDVGNPCKVCGFDRHHPWHQEA